MPDSQNRIGAFQIGQARCFKRGEATYEGKSPKELTEQYYVVMEDEKTPPTYANTSGLPAVGSAYDSTSTALRALRVSKVVFSQLEKGSPVWIETVTYTVETKEKSDGADDDEFGSFKVHFGTAEDSADVTTDLGDLEPLVNSAGDPFDSVPQKRTFAPEIRLEWTARAFPKTLYSKNGHINSAEFTYGPVTFPRHGCMLTCEVDENGDEDRPWKVTLTLTGRINVVAVATAESDSANPVFEETDIGWDIAFVQAGFQYLNEDGEKVKFTVEDADGGVREPSLPMPLDWEGHPSAVPAMRHVRVYPETDFSALPLPNALQELGGEA